MTPVTSPSHQTARKLTPSGFSHISVPVRDVEQSKRFYVEVLGGGLVRDTPGFAEARFSNFIVGMSSRSGHPTAPTAEYPHYGFTVEPDQFLSLKLRLEAYGVPTHEPWTRHNDAEALMYFRDPSGNQFEMYCPKGFKDLPLRRGGRAGGDFFIDFPALGYKELRTLPSGAEAPKARVAGFNHMTIPVRDMYEGKRFLMEVLGGDLVLELPDHITVAVGGAQIGMAPMTAGWTAYDAEFPHYAFFVDPEDMAPLKERLEAYGVPTHDIWTRNGIEALMYFRDPSGNLLELYCKSGFKGADKLPRGGAGGDYTIDFAALNFDHWKDPGM
jgi:catechol 2,3-dioxygenase-like lactoylglutathione lyase family enzyme